ncbi:uncharacterized protein DSM5745_06480 [Aspergillus mulundensis]|uniref:Uncharacterized protein n=1 Tax=Aspergillus mulundensis TaxID=1810919 RepID=A0A3D8RRB2_9EURO|nr:hypothetical protein DSM5745_06480 [Aspergillus mulundensis]RDW76488.1 hypothetical protein DSM5745_06480 [Aspergillus mulundensis]
MELSPTIRLASSPLIDEWDFVLRRRQLFPGATQRLELGMSVISEHPRYRGLDEFFTKNTPDARDNAMIKWSTLAILEKFDKETLPYDDVLSILLEPTSDFGFTSNPCTRARWRMQRYTHIMHTLARQLASMAKARQDWMVASTLTIIQTRKPLKHLPTPN